MEQHQNNDRDPIQLGSEIAEVLRLDETGVAQLSLWGAELQLEDALAQQATDWNNDVRLQQANEAIRAADHNLQQKRAAQPSE